MSIAVILNILNFIRKNWKYILAGGLIICFTVAIIILNIKINNKDKQIKELNIQIERLEATNAYNEKVIKDKNTQLAELSIFTNSDSYIGKIDVIELSKQEAEAYYSIIKDILDSGNIGISNE